MDDGAAPDALGGGRLLVQHALGELQAVTGNLHDVAAAPVSPDQFRSGFQNDGSVDVIGIEFVLQRLFEGFVGSAFRSADIDIASGAPVAMPPVVIEHAAPQAGVGGLLVGPEDRGDDPQPARVGLIPEAFVGHLPRHLGDIVGPDGELVDVALDVQVLFLRLDQLRLVDEIQLSHPAQDVQLAQFGPLRIRHRIETGRGLRQAGQHGHLGQAEVLQGLAEIDLRSGGKTVGALPEVDLIDVNLENFVLGETAFDLEREQRFVDLARQRLFARKEEVPRHLHGDRAGALALAAAGEVRIGGAQYAEGVHPGMLVEALVFSRQNGLFHDVRDVLDADQRAALFAEFPDQVPVGGIDTQRNLRLVVGQHLDRRQLGISQDDDDGEQGGPDQTQAGQDEDRIGEPA
jgi:hypothetical protein